MVGTVGAGHASKHGICLVDRCPGLEQRWPQAHITGTFIAARSYTADGHGSQPGMHCQWPHGGETQLHTCSAIWGSVAGSSRKKSPITSRATAQPCSYFMYQSNKTTMKACSSLTGGKRSMNGIFGILIITDYLERAHYQASASGSAYCPHSSGARIRISNTNLSASQAWGQEAWTGSRSCNWQLYPMCLRPPTASILERCRCDRACTNNTLTRAHSRAWVPAAHLDKCQSYPRTADSQTVRSALGGHVHPLCIGSVDLPGLRA